MTSDQRFQLIIAAIGTAWAILSVLAVWILRNVSQNAKRTIKVDMTIAQTAKDTTETMATIRSIHEAMDRRVRYLEENFWLDKKEGRR